MVAQSGKAGNLPFYFLHRISTRMATPIHLICYGITRDILGGSTRTLSVEDPATVGQVRSLLTTLYPQLGDLTSLRFAFNETYVSDSFELPSGAELVLIPPVSGG